MTRNTNKKSLFFFLLLLPVCLQARFYPVELDYLNPNNPDRKKYIARFKRICVEEMDKTGIPASIKMAQGILESGDGKSSLAVKANNHFGIKCGRDWKGPTFALKDDDYIDGKLVESCFRVYDNPEQSYRDHSAFLTDPKKKTRYGFLFNIPLTDYKEWAKGLQKSGYATNPKYADLLIGIIEANELNRLDFLSPDQLGETPANPSMAGAKVFYNNDVKFVYAKEGDTPASISKKMDMRVSKIVKYNDLKTEQVTYKENDRVYLQRKRKSFRDRQKQHIVKQGETMHSISQQYGIRLDKLYEKNLLAPTQEPAVGQVIVLQGKIKESDKPLTRNKEEKELPSFILPWLKYFDELNRTPSTGSASPSPAPSKEEPSTKPVSPANNETPPPAVPISIPSKADEAPVVEPDSLGIKPMPLPTPNTHLVQKGETLFSIAKKYNIAVDKLKSLNNMTTDQISVGQVLKIE